MVTKEAILSFAQTFPELYLTDLKTSQELHLVKVKHLEKSFQVFVLVLQVAKLLLVDPDKPIITFHIHKVRYL